jgi:hypothetical protein
MADKFFSTKRSAEALKETEAAITGTSPERELYPWGLSISLDSDTLEVVPVPTGLSVGAVVEFTVRAKVRRLSEEETTEGAERRIEFQIIEMTEPTQYTAPVANADRIYGKKAEAAE